MRLSVEEHHVMQPLVHAYCLGCACLDVGWAVDVLVRSTAAYVSVAGADLDLVCTVVDNLQGQMSLSQPGTRVVP